MMDQWPSCETPLLSFQAGADQVIQQPSRSLDAQRPGLRAQRPAEHGVGRLAPGVHPLDHPNASQTMRHVADQLRAKCPSWARSTTTARPTC